MYAIFGCIPSSVGPGVGGGETSSNCQGATSITTTAPFLGRGRFGQLDMAGNLAEWTLDVYADYVTPCDDCAALTGGTQRVIRGGAFDKAKAYLYTSQRDYGDPGARFSDVGFRCARVP
jgi:formylglycine-generating enzyme required for sulfatase activity